MKNKINVNINYISNFSPNMFKNFENFKNKNKKKIICRNFLLFLFLLKFVKNFFSCNNITIFVKPKTKNFVNILRAPYKNKLSKHQIGLVRYFIKYSFSIQCKSFYLNNLNDFFNFLKHFKIFFFVLETNIVYNYKINFYFKFNFKNFFLNK